MEIRASMRQEGGARWVAEARLGHGTVRATGSSRERCLRALRREIDGAARAASPREPVTLLVETVPTLAGVAEAAQVMGWDKRRVITYIDRGRFPEPIQALASGRIWLRSDVEAFAEEWRARLRRKRRPS